MYIYHLFKSVVKSCSNPFMEPTNTKRSCQRKRQEPLVCFEHTTDRLRVRRITHCSTPSLNHQIIVYIFDNQTYKSISEGTAVQTTLHGVFNTLLTECRFILAEQNIYFILGLIQSTQSQYNIYTFVTFGICYTAILRMLVLEIIIVYVYFF